MGRYPCTSGSGRVIFWFGVRHLVFGLKFVDIPCRQSHIAFCLPRIVH